MTALFEITPARIRVAQGMRLVDYIPEQVGDVCTTTILLERVPSKGDREEPEKEK